MRRLPATAKGGELQGPGHVAGREDAGDASGVHHQRPSVRAPGYAAERVEEYLTRMGDVAAHNSARSTRSTARSARPAQAEVWRSALRTVQR